MKLLLSDITDEGLVLDFREDVALEDVSLVSPVEMHIEVDKRGGEIVVSGSLRASVRLQCSRCLKEFTVVIDSPVNVVYHPAGELGVERHELKDDEMDMGFYTGEEIDLQELVREQVMLNMQMKPLCAESCKGLCSKCGADLNLGQCSCPATETDPRLEVLKNFFKRKE